MASNNVLYIGPHRVDIRVAYIGGLLCLTKPDGLNIIGYPNLVRGIAFVQYNIDHLPSSLQAAFRTEKIIREWSALMCLNGKIWEGPMSYLWELNDLRCYLGLKDD